MSQVAPNTASLQLPAELVQRIEQSAKALGMDISTYLVFLEQCRLGRLDPKAQDAVKFMITHHDQSLRKLAQ